MDPYANEPLPPPGWYPDPWSVPGVPSVLRYWDGRVWTAATVQRQPRVTDNPALVAVIVLAVVFVGFLLVAGAFTTG